ncbi:MAG: hypothetical protein AVDCRST_MAG49-116 [uncultured Thermomicrobiales bacterium]|uniref:Ester cyclase n=1 Tax=uncultured Thermomicrobiales bacterium TaxID=1645740 RepID=A0A6J4TWD9_9BACT|nr:MAG: hypothetical protein AVDCRST_MAG49-116 [uncultured Thermomicrobiales bacterium]
MTDDGAGEIDLRRKGSIDRVLAPGQPRRQRLRGFDDEYADIVDYIIRCTHRIWEELGVGLIYTHYRHNSVIHAGNDDVYGREAVVANTLQTLAAFPDRKLYGDDVIWSGDDEAGFHTSHHLTTVGRNTGHSAYGPPTGRKLSWRSIAHCVVLENEIVEEWLLRDEIAVVRQLGLDEQVLAAARARSDLERGASVLAVGPVERGLGQLAPQPLSPASTGGDTGFDPADFVRRTLHDVWNRRLLNLLRASYDESYRGRYPSGRRFAGPGDLAVFVLGLLAAFPDAKVTTEHLMWLGDGRGGYRVAVRWRFDGTHEGHGEWGPPSGARVRMLGLSHLRVVGGRIAEESTLFDEFALLTQVWAARLAAGTEPARTD